MSRPSTKNLISEFCDVTSKSPFAMVTGLQSEYNPLCAVVTTQCLLTCYIHASTQFIRRNKSVVYRRLAMAFRMNRRRLRAALLLNTSGRGATGRARPVRGQPGGVWGVGKSSEGPERGVGEQPGASLESGLDRTRGNVVERRNGWMGDSWMRMGGGHGGQLRDRQRHLQTSADNIGH